MAWPTRGRTIHLAVGVLLRLKGQSRAPAHEIADDLGVSERTVRRYIREFAAAGYPVPPPRRDVEG